MKRKGMNIEAAEKYVVDTDEKRFQLIQAFLDKKPLNIDYLFDATINTSSFSAEDVSNLILAMFDKKVEKQIVKRKKLRKVF